MFSGESSIGLGYRMDLARPLVLFRLRFLWRCGFRAGGVFPCFADAVQGMPRGSDREALGLIPLVVHDSRIPDGAGGGNTAHCLTNTWLDGDPEAEQPTAPQRKGDARTGRVKRREETFWDEPAP